MQLVVEYLAIIPKEGSFCDSIDTLARLLQVDSAISIKKGVLTFEGDFACDFQIASGEVAGKEQRFFHLRLSTNTTKEEIETSVKKFTALLKKIRTTLAKAGGLIEVLWDDISFLYSKEAYSQIYEIENLMRKLIANFMLVTVGKEWVNETSPTELQEVISKSKRKDYVNILHTIDFIHLADFLTKPYSKKPIQELYAKLSKASGEDSLSELREYIPKSNWQRYFSSLVDCEDSYLSKRWGELYELRCKVAHNAIVTKADRERTSELVSDLRSKLEDALLKLPQVSVPREERELVAESAVSNVNALFGEFIYAWRALEEQIERASYKLGIKPYPLIGVVDMLRRVGKIDPELRFRIVYLTKFRNELVHGQIFGDSEAEMRERIVEARQLAEILGRKIDSDRDGADK